MRTSPHEPPQMPLSDEQRREQALIAKAHMEASQAWQATINKAMGEIELRKWCVEQANIFVQGTELEVVPEAAKILLFIGEPFLDIEKKPAT